MPGVRLRFVDDGATLDTMREAQQKLNEDDTGLAVEANDPTANSDNSVTSGASAPPPPRHGIGDLSFDRADFSDSTPVTDGAAAADGRSPTDPEFRCTVCDEGVHGEYYQSGDAAVCALCRERVLSELAEGHGSVASAFAYGAGAGALGALGYYAVTTISGYELGIIAIAVGYAVGRGVRHGAGTRDHWIYRAMALVLTYVAMVATYIPAILSSLGEFDLLSIAIALVLSLGAPYFFITEGQLMGLVILAIGLWQSWSLTAGPRIVLDGPFYAVAKETEAASMPEKRPVD
ncbi:MAG: hypothetical protein HRU17_11865 [Polyangiaceae bacterium]|nr:hypothetical protein [Polyangiaceae bacterium]